MRVVLDDQEAPMCVTIETAGVVFHITASGVSTGLYVSSAENLMIEPTAQNRVLVCVKKEVEECGFMRVL